MVAVVAQEAMEVPAPLVMVPSPQIKGITAPALQKYPVVQGVEVTVPLVSAKVPAGVFVQIICPSDPESMPQAQRKGSAALVGQYEPDGQLTRRFVPLVKDLVPKAQ